MSAWTAAMSAAVTKTGSRRLRARAWFHSIAMAGSRIPPNAVSLSSRRRTISRVPGSSTRFANRECSRSSRSSSCPTGRNLRRLQQNIAPEAEHVLDWFHVTMRLTVLGDTSRGLDRRGHGRDQGSRAGPDQWLLWHGNAPDAIDDVECLADDVAGDLEENPPRYLYESLPPRSVSSPRISPITWATSVVFFIIH